MKNEVTTFLVLLFLGVSIVLGVLLLQEKREALSRGKQPAQAAATNTAQPLSTAIPTPRTYQETIKLPAPKTAGGMPIQTALEERRTRRVFSEQKVTLAELGQSLWAGQGITVPGINKRTAPSARETYFYTIFVVVKNVKDLEPGLYEYLPKQHALGKMAVADIDAALKASGVQEGAQKAPVVFLLSAAYGKGAATMKEGAKSSALLEGGHIGQNIYLQTESLGMATVVMAGFDPMKVGQALNLDPAETVVYVVPFGHRGVEAPTTDEK